MTPVPVLRLSASFALLLALLACGGGGSSSGDPIVGPIHPNSGIYGWVLKASGDPDALKYGLSLVHPAQPEVEVVLEAPTAVVSDARVLSSASVDTAQRSTSANQAHTLVYIVGGDVRTLPLRADGSAPHQRVQRSQSSSACSFELEATDHATPTNSRFVASTAGADGRCDSADDGRAEVRLTASGAPVFSPLQEVPLGVVRSPQTLAPLGWVMPRGVALYSGSTIATRAASAPAYTQVLAAAPESLLVADNTRLAVLQFGGTTASETALSGDLPAGNGWLPLGFDRTHFYAYLNSGSGTAAAWKLIRVTRTLPQAVQLAAGAGTVVFAGMGRDMLYLSVLGSSTNRLLRVAKSGGIAATISSATNVLDTVLTSASDVHQRLRASGLDTTAVTYTVEMVDEADRVLTTIAGGLPMSLAEAASTQFDSSESRNVFLVAGDFGARAFADATLFAYDAAARSSRVLGRLPGRVEYGNDDVFAQVIAGPSPQGLGYAARFSAGRVEVTGSRVFSYDVGVANSLKTTTITR